ncbi:MAG TPA: hypothetical protein VFO74_05705 [Pseudolabrys sp.]|nr:hypothetical protein [Pseudolabrys sp.]
MTFPYERHFDARLPLVATAVRITSLYDAQVFMRRWVIRDKDRNLKALLRRLERANSAARIATAMEEFKRALAAHALLPKDARSSWVRLEAPADHDPAEHSKERP